MPVAPPAAGFSSPADVIGRGVGVVSPEERFPEAEEARSGLQNDNRYANVKSYYCLDVPCRVRDAIGLTLACLTAQHGTLVS